MFSDSGLRFLHINTVMAEFGRCILLPHSSERLRLFTVNNRHQIIFEHITEIQQFPERFAATWHIKTVPCNVRKLPHVRTASETV